MSIEMDKAIQDLAWLSNRFSGILAVKKELENYNSLSNQAAELQRTIKQLQAEASLLILDKDKYLADNEAIRTEGKDILSKAVSAAKDVVEDANKQAKDIVSKATEEGDLLFEQYRSEKVKLDADILNKHSVIKDIEKNISTITNKLNKLQADYDALRNKLI